MSGDPPADQDETAGDGPATTLSLPPEKMGLPFYGALALVGLLVLMVVFLNYPAARASSGTIMTQMNWTLESLMNNTGMLVTTQSGTEVSALFNREGRMSGNAGCNQYSAAYQTQDYSINISGTSSTKMFCPGPGVMEQESAFLSDLSKVSSFRVSESALKLYDSAGKTVLVFVPE